MSDESDFDSDDSVSYPHFGPDIKEMIYVNRFLYWSTWHNSESPKK